MAVNQETVSLTTSSQLRPPSINIITTTPWFCDNSLIITALPSSPFMITTTPPSSPIKFTNTPPSSPIKITNTPPSSPIKITNTPPSSPIKITNTPPSSPIQITNTPPSSPIKSTTTVLSSPIKISQDHVINMEIIAYNPQVYWRAGHSRIFILFLIVLGLTVSTLLHASLIALAVNKSSDSYAFISYLQHSVGYNLSELVIVIAFASGTALLMIHFFAKQYPGYPLYIKYLLLNFLFGIIAGPSMMFLKIFATQLRYTMCVLVVLAAYLGGLSYYIGLL